MRTLEHIGYVAGINYNSEGKMIEWLYGKDDLCGYNESAKLFKTESGARKHLDKFDHIGKPYVRKYYREGIS